ncbi:MAG: D-hexose-6-phosphate mutarotase [Panacagrimonas sp.]
MQTLPELNRRFGIHGYAAFEEREPGMIRLRLISSESEATLYLHGAHLTHWAPRGASPVLYLSPKAVFAPGKAIRGGVPVLFPWFGPRWNGEAFDAAHRIKSPAHGFARTAVWTVTSVTRAPEGEIVAVLSLGPDAVSRSLGYDDFALALECRIGRELHLALHVTNHGTAPMVYEEGLHTYFAVTDVRAVRLEGLAGTRYLDKRDDSKGKVQHQDRFAFTRDIDQVYLHTGAPIVLHDPAGHRVVHIAKTGSRTTVIWNPWDVLTPGFADLAADSWQHFACVETANADEDRVLLAAGATHRLAMTLGVSQE